MGYAEGSKLVSFAKFMASQAGRLLRIVAGVALVALGRFATQSPLSVILLALGVVFVLVGVFNVCLLAPLMGLPLKGKDVLSR